MRRVCRGFAGYDVEDVPVFEGIGAVGCVALLLGEVYRREAGDSEQSTDLTGGVVRAIGERCPGVAIAKELPGEEPVGTQGVGDAGPEVAEVIWGAEGQCETGVEERAGGQMGLLHAFLANCQAGAGYKV